MTGVEGGVAVGCGASLALVCSVGAGTLSFTIISVTVGSGLRASFFFSACMGCVGSAD